NIESLSILARAQGTGFATAANGGALDGASLLVWRPTQNGWVEVGATEAGIGRPGEDIEYEEVDVTESRASVSDDDLLYFAVQPTFPLGSGENPAEVALDYVEVRVKYRR
ncbi:MAG: hypothetical protein AAFQ82_09480, partial [Myxococcota bacterium]